MVALRLRAKQWLLGSVKFFGLEHRTLGFLQFRYDIFSTGGVDGVLESMVEKLAGIPRVFVDLGAENLDRQVNIMWTHGYVCVLHIGNVFPSLESGLQVTFINRVRLRCVIEKC